MTTFLQILLPLYEPQSRANYAQLCAYPAPWGSQTPNGGGLCQPARSKVVCTEESTFPDGARSAPIGIVEAAEVDIIVKQAQCNDGEREDLGGLAQTPCWWESAFPPQEPEH